MIDSSGNTVGQFYNSLIGLTKRKLVVDVGVRLDCYSRSYGKTRNIFIHKEGMQIAEIVIPLSRTNGFWCFIYLLDEYLDFDKILFLVASGSTTGGTGISRSSSTFNQLAGVSISTEHTKGGYSSLHDRDWVTCNFGVETVAAVNSEIIEHRELAKSMMNRKSR